MRGHEDIGTLRSQRFEQLGLVNARGEKDARRRTISAIEGGGDNVGRGGEGLLVVVE